MKMQHLEETINSIKLSGEIDPDYRVPPGITITFDRHSTFAGIVIPNGTKFYNDEYVVKKFVFDPSSGKILLTSIELTAQDGHLFKSQKLRALDLDSPKDSGDGDERLPHSSHPSAGESEPISPLVSTFHNELQCCCMNIKISIRGVINKGKERIIRNKNQLIWGSGKELAAAIWIILFKIEHLTLTSAC